MIFTCYFYNKLELILKNMAFLSPGQQYASISHQSVCLFGGGYDQVEAKVGVQKFLQTGSQECILL